MNKLLSPSTSLVGGRTFAWFLLILANVLWAGSYVAAKFALEGMSVNMLNALRMCGAALILLPIFVIKRKSLRLTRSDLPELAVLALVGFVINKIFEYGGLALTTASDVALLISCESIFTALLSWLLLRERFRWLTAVALVIGAFGVYLIVERSLIPNIPAGGGIWRIVGDLMVILSLLVETFYTIRGKSLLARHSPLMVTAAAIIGSAIFWLPMGAGEILLHGWTMPGWQSWLGIGWLIVMSTVLAYLCWFAGLARINGSSAATTLFIQPLLGTLLAILLVGDQLVATTIIGGVLILVSVFLISRQEQLEQI